MTKKSIVVSKYVRRGIPALSADWQAAVLAAVLTVLLLLILLILLALTILLIVLLIVLILIILIGHFLFLL